MFEKVLVANRGEIACRIIRAAKRLGIKTIVVYSEADKDMPFVQAADERWALGGALAKDSYLNRAAILEAAKASKAEAIHPGYGFLAEDAGFAHEVAQAGLIFIGPSVDTMLRIHDKSAARLLVKAAGVPVVPGSNGQVADVEAACVVAATLGYPVLCKAAGGGGGIGMASAANESELRRAFVSCQQRSLAAFGNPGVYLERFFEAPRHVEVQLLADRHGHCIHLGERECSIQRRHQKIIEEAGSPLFEGGAYAKLREGMLRAALCVAAAFNYSNVGTVEFLVSGEEFFFIEFNARLQVEHPITELTTGVDLVAAQFHMAAGMPLQLQQSNIASHGHAIEFRLCAEDPIKFLPSPGEIKRLEFPPEGGAHCPSKGNPLLLLNTSPVPMATALRGEGGEVASCVRIDSGYAQGSRVTPYYDSLLAKIIVHAPTRALAIEKARQALSECHVEGIKTNLPLHRQIVEDADFQAGRLTTRFLERFSKKRAAPMPLKETGL
ncbi:MAG: biotin carboxylase [Cystobacterineae bacterium]|nr:biotin carboxylase [Cystobacterineae bacterium]